MKAMQRKNVILGLTSTCSFALSVLLLMVDQTPYVPITITFALLTAVLWLTSQKKWNTAQLIAGNPIMHIQTSLIKDVNAVPVAQHKLEQTKVIVSYFGILIGEKIIKFNQDGIQLREVEFGKDFISFTYGNNYRTQVIRLLRPMMDKQTMEEISERFRYETGIRPTFWEENSQKKGE